MPAKNPRVHVTLKPSVAAALQRIASLQKRSQSAIVGELLEASEPVFNRMALVLEAAERAKAGVKEQVRANLEAAEHVLDEQLGLMLGDLEERSTDLVDGLEAIRRRSGREGAGRTDAQRPPAPGTPPSNRGVVPTPRTEGKRRVSKAKRRRG